MIMVLIHGESNVKKDFCDIIHIQEGESGVNLASGSFGIQNLTSLELQESKWILFLITYNTVIIYYLSGWTTLTNSISLSAYTNTVVFNILSLLVCLISVWISRNSSLNKEPHNGRLTTTTGLRYLRYTEYRPSCGYGGIVNSSSDSNFVDTMNINHDVVEMPNNRKSSVSLSKLGVVRYEVFALFVSSCLILYLNFLLTIKIIYQLRYQPIIYTAQFGFGALLGMFAHLVTIFVYPDTKLNHVIYLALPCPTWNGFNPIFSGNIASVIILFITHIVIHIWNFHMADAVAAVAVIGLTTISMLPLAFYTSNVLLQKVPYHMIMRLDKCLREALNIDGVVEFRNERFWMMSFGKLAGSLQVRIRRNTNENYVMENVMKHLSKIISSLDIREFRDSRLVYQTTSINCTTSIYPPEYYINEILPRIKNKDISRCDNKFTESLGHEDVKVMKIDEFLNIKCNNNNTIQFETFANGSSSICGGSSSRSSWYQ